jgi:8-oxo-dGTP pyrophosphatase MutT (NUDIX family)
MAGGIHEGESVLDGLKREFKEELSLEPNDIKFKKIRVEFREDKNRNFHFYHGFTSKEFVPKLDHENKEYGWFSKDKLPSPLYEGMEEKIKTI